MQFISFTIGDEEYAVDVMSIREIKGWTATTELPDQSAHMRGVIDLRGTIVPIMDLRARLGGGRTEATPRHVIIVLAAPDGGLAGILVDAVADILTAEAGDIQPVPDLDHADGPSVLLGVLPRDGRMVALLDLDGLFPHPPLTQE